MNWFPCSWFVPGLFCTNSPGKNWMFIVDAWKKVYDGNFMINWDPENQDLFQGFNTFLRMLRKHWITIRCLINTLHIFYGTPRGWVFFKCNILTRLYSRSDINIVNNIPSCFVSIIVKFFITEIWTVNVSQLSIYINGCLKKGWLGDKGVGACYALNMMKFLC